MVAEARDGSVVELTKIIQILTILKLSEDKIADTSAKSKEQQHKGKFFDEIAVSLGYVTSERLNKGLGEQAKLFAEAVEKGINTMVDS